MSRPDKLAVHVFEVDEDVDKDEVSFHPTLLSVYLTVYTTFICLFIYRIILFLDCFAVKYYTSWIETLPLKTLHAAKCMRIPVICFGFPDFIIVSKEIKGIFVNLMENFFFTMKFSRPWCSICIFSSSFNSCMTDWVCILTLITFVVFGMAWGSA